MRLGFMASGRGSNVEAIIKSCLSGELNAQPVLVISNHGDAGALELAKHYDLEAFHLSSKTHPDPESLDIAITDAMVEHQIELVVLAGYMRKIGQHLLGRFENRIINIHPSLLPKFGGKGMYGINVHQAVIAAGEQETGATIHLVNAEYDKGKILQQGKVKVLPDDTAESLAKRVLAVEHVLYPDTIKKIIAGEIKL